MTYAWDAEVGVPRADGTVVPASTKHKKKKSKAPFIIGGSALAAAALVAALVLPTCLDLLLNKPGVDVDGITPVDGSSVNLSDPSTQPANADGSIGLAVKPGEASSFAVPAGDSDFIVVNLPEGTFGAYTQLNVSRVTSKLDGIVFPGFTVT